MRGTNSATAWTPEQMHLLRTFYPTGEREAVMAAINAAGPRRTWTGITVKAQREGINRFGEIGETPDDIAETRTRRCAWQGCINRFIPVNANQRWCSPQCQELGRVHPDRVWSMEEQLQEQAGVAPTTNGFELAKTFSGKLAKAQRKLAERETLEQYLKSLVGSMFEAAPEHRLPAVIAPQVSRGDSERVAMLLLSDWQVGKLEKAVGLAETRRRIARTTEAFRSIVEHQRKAGHQVNEAVLVLLGDMVEGCYIFPGQQISGLDRLEDIHMLTEQIRVTAGLIGDVVRDVASYVPRVRVISEGGNHGRTNVKGVTFADMRDNFDTLTAYWARDLCANLTHVEWQIDRDWFGTFSVLDWQVVAMHGDKWRGSLTALETLLPRWVTDGEFGVRPDLFLCGHRHYVAMQDINGIRVLQNGTLDGGSSWYQMTYGKSARPGQVALIVSRQHLIEYLSPIDFPSE